MTSGADVNGAPTCLDERALMRMRRAAARAGEDEACGLLLGRASRPDLALGAVACPNLSRTPRVAFELDPARWVRCDRLARRHGLTVVGVWHSHPRGGAAPSAADIAGAPAGLLSAVLDGRVGAQGSPAEVHVWRPGSGRLA